MFKRLRDNLFGRPGQAPAEMDAERESVQRDQQQLDQPGDIAQSLSRNPAAEQASVESAGTDVDVNDAQLTTSAEPIPEVLAPADEPIATPTTSPPTSSREASARPAPPHEHPSEHREDAAPSTSVGWHVAEEDNDDNDDNDDNGVANEEVIGPESPTQGRGLFKNPFRFSLGRTRQLFGRVNQALAADDITDDLWDELEETLISSDVGVATSERLMATLRERAQVESMTRGSQLRGALKEELELLLGEPEPLVFSDTSPLTAYLIVGVNGVGKTTSIAKLANVLKRSKHRVLLAAGDTFRAAATEQIKLWGERIGVPVVSHQHGADPAAVVYDAVQAAQARKCDVLIVDTAGRLHTKFNLMEELKKISRVLQKYDSEAPHEVLLVIDATTGQNGYLQAKQFIADAGVSGIILTKLDGTARGGIVFAIASELGLPIKYIGTGEKVGDLAEFDPIAFVTALFEED